jgi:hypothetical protein
MDIPNKNPQSKRRARTRNEGGFVLVISLLTLALMSSLGLAALYQSNSEMTVVGNQRVGNELLLAADSGVEYAKNAIWAESGFSANSTVTFTNLDDYFVANPLPLTIGPLNVSGDIFYSAIIPNSVTVPDKVAPVSGYDDTDGSKRLITFQARAWHDTNGNGSYDVGEKSRLVTARVAFEYTVLDFPYGVLTQNVECIFCHAKIVGDVVSLETMTVRTMDEAYSSVLGKVYTMGTTNLNDPQSRVVNNYVDQDGDYSTVEDAGETALDITTNYADPDRFPVDSNGNPSFPKIENLAYYKGLASTYGGGAGSSVSGTGITVVPMGSTYATGKSAVASISQGYAGNVILEGTPGNCVQLNGPVVVDGDVIIKGCVSGEGSIYAGGNVFVAGSVTYSDAGADRLALAAGGNIVMGDYRTTGSGGGSIGGGDFIEKQLWQFNKQVQSTYPPGERRYYAAADGKIYTGGKSIVTPGAGDTVVSYLPSESAGGAQWITTGEYTTNYVDNVNGITELDALAYTANGIFGINKVGDKKTTVNGALVSADIGILIPGPNGKNKSYDPNNVGLTLVYDDRMQTFLAVARNPTKTVVSWKEGT